MITAESSCVAADLESEDDSRGNLIGDPNQFELRAGVAVHADFIGDPSLFPGCAGGVLTSIELIDRLTRATR